jgi:hypothetical protein
MKKNKSFDAVQMMREIRGRITQETQGMSFQELTAYIERGAAEVRSKIGSKVPQETAKVKA